MYVCISDVWPNVCAIYVRAAVARATVEISSNKCEASHYL